MLRLIAVLVGTVAVAVVLQARDIAAPALEEPTEFAALSRGTAVDASGEVGPGDFEAIDFDASDFEALASAPRLPLAGGVGQAQFGPAGQTIGSNDVTTFGGSTLMGPTWAAVATIGYLTAGQRVTERIITQATCAMRIVHLLVDDGNGARVRKKIGRGTADVTVFTQARFGGMLVSVVNAQGGTSTCSIFRNWTFTS
ncbi:MAG TPA: hypothetical protein DCP38_09570 [Acidobacteria bacterium]|jgi:hypothetical protein|nr:hypothetical protein [Vicinamibacterales bacterium]HAK55715.1 hypothetical protein [Acidobacteriota bacterium]